MRKNPSFKSISAMKIGIACGACVLGIVFFWGFETESGGSKPPEAVIRPVKTIQVSPEVTTEKRSFPGLVYPLRENKLAFRVGGPLVELNVAIGQYVEKDALIARIDARDFEINVIRLEAVLGQAQANLKALKSGARREDIARLKAQLSAAKVQLTTAENEFNRQKNLLAEQVSSMANYDVAQKSYEMAKANFESMTQELKKAQRGGRKEEIEAAQAGIKKIQADLAAAKHALEDTRLVAPYSGYVSRKYVENYENVKAGSAVVAVIDLSRVEVHAAVSEEVVIHQTRISDISCTLSAYPGKKMEASVKEIGRRTESANQSYPFSVVLKVPKNLIVTPGMAANLDISFSASKTQLMAYLLPSQAIFADPQGNSCVWRINTKNMTVIKTPVKVGKIGDGVVQIESGLSPGDRVVTAGARFLLENQKIRILKPTKSA